MHRYSHRLMLGIFTTILLFALSCNSKHSFPEQSASSSVAQRQYRLEKIGPAQVVQLYADGIEKLSAKERIFAYYMSLSCIAARDIALVQHHRDALEVRDLFEEIYRHAGALDPVLKEKIVTYLKLFWINNGFYDNLTGKKFVPEFSFDELIQALQRASKAPGGVDLHNEAIDQKLERLQHVVFDPELDPVLTNKVPGKDWIKGSAVNYYAPGLTFAEVESWAKAGNEKNALNSTVVKVNGKLLEKVWRAGGDGIPEGLYAGPLNAAIFYLEKALPFAASEYQARAIRLLIRYYRTGDLKDFQTFNIQWVKDTSTIDFNHGFLEVYLDPRGQKGEFQAMVYFNDPEQTAMMRNLASNAQYFEDKAPWADSYKKKIDHSPTANVVNVIVETGGVGPITPIGINLPNGQQFREQYGTKSVLLANVQDAYDRSTGEEFVKELSWDQEEFTNDALYGTRANNLHTAMHEVIGHGSGKASPKLKGKDPSTFLPGYYNTLEEARADLVALWNGFDPKLIEIGVAKDLREVRSIGETMYQQQVRTALKQLNRIGKSEQLHEDHFKNRQLIVMWLIKNSNAVKVVEREGKTYYRIVDFDAAHEAVGRLLAEIMRIKAEGDLPAARALLDAYALQVDVKLRDEIQERVKMLRLPAYTGFVMPKLEAINDPTARIVDAKVSYPLDLATQMLEWSAFTKPFRSSMGGMSH